MALWELLQESFAHRAAKIAEKCKASKSTILWSFTTEASDK